MQMPTGIRKAQVPPQRMQPKPRQQPSPPQVDPGPIAGGPTPAGGSGGIYANPNTPAGPRRPPVATSPGPMGQPHMQLPMEPPMQFPLNPGAGNNSMYGVGGGAGGGSAQGADGGAPMQDLGDALMMTVPDWMRQARPMEQNINGMGMPVGGPQIRPQPNPGGGIINLPPNPGPLEGNGGTRGGPQQGGVHSGGFAFQTPPEIQALGPRAVEMFRRQYGMGHTNAAQNVAARFKKNHPKRFGGQGNTNQSFGVPNALP